MKTKTVGLTLAFCFLGAGVCLAADPQMGTWKLNQAKSKITPGTLKFNTVTVKKDGKVVDAGRIVVSADGKSRTVTVSGTTSKGKKFKNVVVYDKQA
jgi:hypothetical protein